MKESEYLLNFVTLAPLQIALIRAEEAFVMAKIKMVKPILDIGCSDGIFGEVLFNGEEGAIDVGIDIDEIALKLSGRKKVYKKVLIADAKKLPFPSDSFSTVISNQSLEHIKNVDCVFNEVARVIKKGGRFIFLVPTIYLDDYWLTSAVFKKVGLKSFANTMHSFRNKIFKHYNLWSIKKWKKLLEKNGFLLKKYQYVGRKDLYFISEIFWIFRIPTYFLSRILRRNMIFPRKYSIILAKIIAKRININEYNTPLKGPTMLIIAQKK